jgi:hypothetical protein
MRIKTFYDYFKQSREQNFSLQAFLRYSREEMPSSEDLTV